MTATRPGDSLRDRHRGYGRTVRVGLAVSVVLHLFLLFGIGRALRIESSGPRPPMAAPAIELQGPLALEIGRVLPPSEVPEEDGVRPPTEDAPAERPRPDRRAQGPPVAAPDGEADAAEAYLTNAKKLQPKEGDERLYPEYADDEIPEYLAQNPYARYEGEIRARLGVILDSLALSEEQRRKAIEWLTGEDGGEWGVSEDGIHVGGVVIPIDLRSLFQEEGEHGREARQELRDLRDIRYQDMLGEADEVREERARQMRERTNAELERRARDSLVAASDSTRDEGSDGDEDE